MTFSWWSWLWLFGYTVLARFQLYKVTAFLPVTETVSGEDTGWLCKYPISQHFYPHFFLCPLLILIFAFWSFSTSIISSVLKNYFFSPFIYLFFLVNYLHQYKFKCTYFLFWVIYIIILFYCLTQLVQAFVRSYFKLVSASFFSTSLLLSTITCFRLILYFSWHQSFPQGACYLFA